MAAIDTTDSRIPCWIVYSMSTSGNLVLHAICLTNYRAVIYKKALDSEENPTRVRVWIHATEANHLYCYNLENVIPEETLIALKKAWSK